MQQYHGLTAEMYRAVIAVVDERVDAIRVTRQDFNRLNRTVGELAQAQRELAQAQARTEKRVEELAQAQARTEKRVEELAQAQMRTEEQVGRLEEGQIAMQGAIRDLAQAQGRTEERLRRLEEGQIALQQGQTALQQGQTALQQGQAVLQQGQAAMQMALQRLAEAQARTEVTVGRLGENIGFGLEDIARLLLPPYLHKHYGIHLEGPAGEELQRRFFPLPDQLPLEINLYGEGQRDGRKAVVLGEAKSRIGGGVVKDFADLLVQIEPLVEGEVWRVMFGYYIHPSAQPVAQEHQILLIASYQR